MRRAILVVMLFVVSAGAALALNEIDLLDVSARMQEASGRNFKIAVDGAQELNACAYPDGRIFVTQGMLEALDRHDQLAFILGHEMTHVIRRHGYGQVKKTIVGMILGAIVAKALGADGDTVRTSAEVSGSLFGAKRSRKDEFASDSGGLQLSYKAGYNPQGAIDSMKLLQRRYGNGMAKAPVLGWFASHPDTGERVRNLEKVAATLPARPVLVAEAPATPAQPLPPEDALLDTSVPEAPVAPAEPQVPVAEPAPAEVSPEPAVERSADPEPVAVVSSVPEIPLGPGEIPLRLVAAYSHKPKAPEGTVKVEFHWLDESGKEFRTFTIPPGKYMGIMVQELDGHGKITMITICRDASDRELARGEKHFVLVP